MARLVKRELLTKVMDGLRSGGASPILIEAKSPFLIRASAPDGALMNLRVYVYNCTHGGNLRANDEYRIQVTVPHLEMRKGEICLLLGWHDEIQAFAAWNPKAYRYHRGQSPSTQVKEGTLLNALSLPMALQRTKTLGIVVAFRSPMLADYAYARDEIHEVQSDEEVELIERLDTASQQDIDRGVPAPRRIVFRAVAVRYRAHDFRDRVLTAYGSQCAVCDAQLGLVDAAHISPVSFEGSTDETSNGVALCKLHHFAFDTALISFDHRYKVEVSKGRLDDLEDDGLPGGAVRFRKDLFKRLALPAREVDWPSARYIRDGKRARGWQP